MEAATSLIRAHVRTLNGHLLVDGLQVDDECAVRLAHEREEAGADPAKFVRDAIGIGARVLDREQASANVDFVRAEFERAARELDSDFVERARRVAEALDKRLAEAFGPESGHVPKLLERHFGHESAAAVQHQIRAAMSETLTKSREDLVRQFSSADASNPLADFKLMAARMMEDASKRQGDQLLAMTQRLEEMRLEIEKLHAEREKLAVVEAERERGTAKGRSYETEVAEALDRLALAAGDVCEAVGDVSDGARKTGDVVVTIDAASGPARGRIVFEAKDRKLSRPAALEELDRALSVRSADFAVLVVPSEDELPARMQALREYNGDKLIVVHDPGDSPLALQVGYALARARVLMKASDADGIDAAAIGDCAERAIAAMEDVRRIKQQLTGAKTQIEKATDIVDVMATGVRQQLGEIETLLRPGLDVS
jgi:hypothetical protein